MYLYVELWNAKQAWKDLSVEERQAYVGAVGGAIQQLMASGAEILGWGINAEDTDHRADYTYIGVWKFPSKEAAQGFEGMVTQAGWHNYFEQVSAASPLMSPIEVMGHAISL
jgi:hypothetical protein